MNQRELDKAVKAAFAAVPADLERVRGDVAAERALWEAFVDRLIALRVAAGHEAPTLLLGEIIVLEGWGKHAPPVFELIDRGTMDEARRWRNDILGAVDARDGRPSKPKAKTATKTRTATKAKPKKR